MGGGDGQGKIIITRKEKEVRLGKSPIIEVATTRDNCDDSCKATTIKKKPFKFISYRFVLKKNPSHL